MRKILWVVIVLVCLIPVVFITLSFIKATPKDVMDAQNNFIRISQQHINNEIIDVNSISGSDANAQFVKIFAEFLNNLSSINSRLATVKNNLIIMGQPTNLLNPQSIADLKKKEADTEVEIASIKADTETAVQDLVKKVDLLDKKELRVVDVKAFIDSMNAGKPERDKEMDQYSHLAQYIKAMLDLVATRPGYYQLAQQDGTLRFTRPEDQQYYNGLVSGVNQYVKLIDDLRKQHDSDDRKLVNDMNPNGH